MLEHLVVLVLAVIVVYQNRERVKGWLRGWGVLKP